MLLCPSLLDSQFWNVICTYDQRLQLTPTLCSKDNGDITPRESLWGKNGRTGQDPGGTFASFCHGTFPVFVPNWRHLVRAEYWERSSQKGQICFPQRCSKTAMRPLHIPLTITVALPYFPPLQSGFASQTYKTMKFRSFIEIYQPYQMRI